MIKRTSATGGDAANGALTMYVGFPWDCHTRGEGLTGMETTMTEREAGVKNCGHAAATEIPPKGVDKTAVENSVLVSEKNLR